MSDNPIPEENGASSLRAAALLTLKSKRRKPVVDTSGIPGPSQRPPTTDTSVQLDYGQEDIGSSPTDVVMAPASLKGHPEDGQSREEGEISDSEDSPSKNASKPAPDPAAVVVKVESPTHNLLDRTGDSPPPGLSPPTPVPLAEYIIDADHVRPGLSMNQDQYDTAKDIVLDLLGWGVPPDYLVDCNLSREIVYYVFSELNLRLPQNLDTTGLIPYTPAHVALLSRPLPPPAAPRSLHGHPSLPPKPHVGPNSATASGPSPVQRSTAPSPPQPSSPPSASSPTSSHQNSAGSLHDMERQRRQELLARKAVQASRKVKPPSDASSTASSSFAPADPSDVAQDQDVEMTPAVATEAVDDFLKTIGEKKSVTPEASVPLQSTNDTMDIDEIPGLGGSASSYRSTGASFYGVDPESQSQMPTYSDQVVTSPAESSFSAAQTQSLSQSDPPPSSGESGSTTFGLEHAGYIEQLSHQQALQRRGAKRPTAADFVDFDSGSRNGYGNGSAPLLRRKTASFASVSGHRKLVIDLSDSEGEGEDYVMHDSVDSERWEAGSGYSSPVPGRAVATPVSAGGAGWATPPIGGNMTPAALMEKEQEIRKMRELIAQREKSRMQKMSRSSTNTSMEFPKREEDEGPMSSSSLANGSTVSLNGNGSHVHQEDDNRALNDSVTAASASCSTTPPHIDPDAMPDQRSLDEATPGEQGSVTAETAALQDQLVDGSSLQEEQQEPAAGLVDVDSALSSSAQVQSPTIPTLPRPAASRPTSPGQGNKKDYDYYAAYDSPLQWYPLLRLRSRHMFSAQPQASSSASHSPSATDSSLSSFPSTSSIGSVSSSSIPSLPSSSSSTYLLPDLGPLKLATYSALDPTKRICQYEVPGGGVCRDEGCEDVHLSRVGGAEPSDEATAEYLCGVLPAGMGIAQLAGALEQERIKLPGSGLDARVSGALGTLGLLIS